MLIGQVLKEWLERGASDIIFAPWSKPCLKIDWEILFLDNFEELKKEELNREVVALLTENQIKRFLENKELDFWIDMKWYSRFRWNAFVQKNWYSAVFRPIKKELPPYEQLWIPRQILDFVDRKHWLILITWSVWSGKSTTLASILEYINSKYSKHIITVEDPIEFVFENKKSVIEQREVWTDTNSFENWLKYALRQASDVIMVWEMRDLETFRLALRAAETWNLVLATLHTSWAARTVSRIIDMFPWDEKEQVKQQLSEALIWVVWQDLLKRSSWKWRVPACEILVNTVSVSNMIRKWLTHQIDWVIETSRKDWMLPMKKSLEELYNSKIISEEEYLYNLSYLWKILG